MSKRLSKLVVDATHLVNQLSGIGYYIVQTAAAMEPLLEGTEIYYFTGLRWQRTCPIGPDDDQGQRVAGRMGNLAPSLPGTRKIWRYWKLLNYTAGIKEIDPDVIYAPSYLPPRLKGPIVPVIHDLSHIRHPEVHPADRLRRMQKLDKLIATAPAILTVSEFSKSEIVEIYGVPSGSVFVASPGVSSVFHPVVKDCVSSVLARYELKNSQYFLSIGTLEPRKNIRTLIDAYKALPAAIRDRVPLVIGGGKGWGDPGMPPKDDELFRSGQLRLLGYVPLSDMPALYTGALAFCYPSIYEGFGMPVVEALACGTSVIASNAASLPEAAGNCGRLIDPKDHLAWSEALREAIDNSEARASQGEIGQRHAARFTWETTAKRTIDAFDHACRVTA